MNRLNSVYKIPVFGKLGRCLPKRGSCIKQDQYTVQFFSSGMLQKHALKDHSDAKNKCHTGHFLAECCKKHALEDHSDTKNKCCPSHLLKKTSEKLKYRSVYDPNVWIVLIFGLFCLFVIILMIWMAQNS